MLGPWHVLRADPCGEAPRVHGSYPSLAVARARAETLLAARPSIIVAIACEMLQAARLASARRGIEWIDVDPGETLIEPPAPGTAEGSA